MESQQSTHVCTWTLAQYKTLTYVMHVTMLGWFRAEFETFFNSWGLRPQTPIWSAFGFHMDPKWVHMDPKIHWGAYEPIWEFETFGSYIGSTLDLA